MRILIRFTALVLLAMLYLLNTGCGRQKTTVTVFAAASLQDALDAIVAEYSSHTETGIEVSYGSSGMLARQILAGARPDIYLSANTRWSEELRQQNTGSRFEVFASNRLVIAGRTGDEIRSMKELAHADIRRIAIGDPSHVPAGIYAKEALLKADLWRQIEHKLIFAVDVRAALAYLEQGSADCAIVYASDLHGIDHIASLEIDSELHSRIEYVACLIKEGESGRKVFEYLLSDKAAKKLRDFSFRSGE